MGDLKITVGGDVIAEARRHFVDAWHRAERGEDFCERHLAFENWDALTRVLTTARAELIGFIRRHEAISVRKPTTVPGRSDHDVLADFDALAIRGLPNTSQESISGAHMTIEATITF